MSTRWARVYSVCALTLYLSVCLAIRVSPCACVHVCDQKTTFEELYKPATVYTPITHDMREKLAAKELWALENEMCSSRLYRKHKLVSALTSCALRPSRHRIVADCVALDLATPAFVLSR